MIRWLWNLLYGAEPKVFVSSYGLEESARRLAAATSRSVFTPFDEMAVGTVTESRVFLRRVMRSVGSAFKPHFIGRFVKEGGRVVLKGRFTIAPFVKVFMSVWFGFFVLLIGLGIRAVLEREPGGWRLTIIGSGFLLAAVAIVWGCKWLASNDVAWLSRVIQDALE